MAKYMKISEAEQIFPGYDDYPNINKSGSLIGMKRIYGWNTKRCLKIGNWIYNLEEHPNADYYFGDE